MRTPIGVIIFLSVMLFLDLYVFQVIKAVAFSDSSKSKSVITIIYWTISVLSLIGFLIFIYTDPSLLGKKIRTYLFAMIIGLMMAKMLAVMIFLIDDLRRMIQWIFGKLFFGHSKIDVASGLEDSISRSSFLSWLGIATGTTVFGSLLYGFGNKYNYKVTNQKLSFKTLPASFKGLKIVHISDIHCGSFLDKSAVERGVEKIMAQQADLILFTGDLVNDKATEMDAYKELFSRVKAPLGVYSTFGNHDYGDYVQWPIEGITKLQNIENLKKVHSDMGWRLLMNEHVVIERGGEQIVILGIENWSNKARFPKYGKMHLAYEGAANYPFKILLSHDPSHWEGEVKPNYPDIDLMLSGHTHGMQYGLEIPGIKWSPIQYIYKQWAGLYEADHQKLYVNRGFGFVGYPGRVGILPEITVLELV